MNSIYSVIIVGAGISGLTAANELKKAGINTLVLDKGRSVGGRLATRRVLNAKLDHGIPWINGQTKEFKKVLEHWIENGWLSQCSVDTYISLNGMNQLTKHLSQNLNIQLQVKVLKIEKEENAIKVIAFDEENQKEIIYLCEHIMISTPIPQTLEMLDEKLVLDGNYEYLTQIHYHPALVALLVLEDEMSLPCMALVENDSNAPIKMIIDQKKKGISNQNAISVYASDQFSEKYFNEEEKALEILLEETKPWLGPNAKILTKQLKKWRYAQVFSQYSGAYLSLHEKPLVILIGDAFASKYTSFQLSGIENAVLSGILGSEHIVTKLTNKQSVSEE